MIKQKKKAPEKVTEKEAGNDVLLASVGQLAHLFGVTDRTIRNWVEKGCPRLSNGKYDLKAVLEWWLENIYGTAMTPETEDVKLEYWRWKKEAERIKVQTLEGSLMSEEQIVQEWSARMAEITNGLQALSRRIPPMIDGKSKSDQQRIIDEEVWKIRDNYCRVGKFCPPEENDASMA